jgi:hypothetical protein
MTLPEAELSFFFAAAAQLEPDLRPDFAERVSAILGAHPDPGPGDVDRAVRGRRRKHRASRWTALGSQGAGGRAGSPNGRCRQRFDSGGFPRACGLNVDSRGVV